MEIKIIPNEFSKQELLFFDHFHTILKKYPFKVYALLNIFRNTEITYARDSSLIVTLTKLKDLTIKDLFELLNFFYQNNHIKKLIYKKEFLIIHFFDALTIKVLCDKTYYMYVDYYFFLKAKGIDTYLNPDVIVQNINEKADLVFCYNNHYYIFDREPKILPYQTFYIDIFMDFNQIGKRKYLKYYLSNLMKEEEFQKIIEEDNS